MDAKDSLQELLRKAVAGKPFSELFDVTLSGQGASLMGDVVLDALESHGYGSGRVDAVGALTAAAVPLVVATVKAAQSRGWDMDGFVMDFVYPSVKGPDVAGKRVVLLDSWLSEKSYVQTSSLVTLRHGNELSLDFGIVEREGAQVVAVASLIGGARQDMLDVVDPVSGEGHTLPFVQVFREHELCGGGHA